MTVGTFTMEEPIRRTRALPICAAIWSNACCQIAGAAYDVARNRRVNRNAPSSRIENPNIPATQNAMVGRASAIGGV